ncbi:MAG: DNA-3-methyladenine glycosylase [Legionella sp.]|nr:DNA-3-methyladenine glycosylase [Legionella sp.]
MRKLSQDFYDRDTTTVAKELLGKYLVHSVNGVEHVGKIVEVEAYLGQHDLAAHTSKGITKRTQIMFGPPGFAYVYLIYGIYYCFNVVTEKEGQGAAVLVRALEPVQNIKLKTQGPGLLCKAMHIDKSLNGHNLQSADFFITTDLSPSNFSVIEKPRIGVHYAGEWATKLLRFYIKDNPFVSKK